MAAASVEGVWAKLARAQEHHDLLEQELRYFIEQDPQPIGLSIPYLRHGSPAGTSAGDLLRNDRSALDHLVWQLVILNGGRTR